MNDLQLATTLVAPTGTGLLYTAYGQGSDDAKWINGTGTGRSFIQMTRTRPKPTPTHQGTHRIETRLVTYVTVNDVEYPLNGFIQTIIPVVADATARTKMSLHLALLARDAIVQNSIASDVVPS